MSAAEQKIERRITYSYGVNRDQVRSGFDSFERLEREVEQVTYGPVDVTKKESRVVSYGKWEEEG